MQTIAFNVRTTDILRFISRKRQINCQMAGILTCSWQTSFPFSQWTCPVCQPFGAYSSGSVQDLHLIPFYVIK